MSLMKNLADKIDQYDAVKAQRLEADRQSKALKSEEIKLKNEIISTLLDENVPVLGGQSLTVQLKPQQVAKADPEQWPTIYSWAVANDATDILYRSLANKAVVDRYERGIAIPGVSIETLHTLSETRVRK